MPSAIRLPSQRRKPGIGDSVAKRLRLAQFLDHLLDQKIAERNTLQPALAVADRIEDRGIGRRGLAVDDVAREQGLDGRRDAAHQRHLDEDQRLVMQRRMEEREAAAVGRQAPTQVFPAPDLVHGLVGDQLLEDRRGRIPVDPPDVEKAAVEPGLKQILQIRVERQQGRLRRQGAQQVAA